jgi:hypothetical protein
MQRPIGVTILAILCFLMTAVMLLAGLGLGLGMGLVGMSPDVGGGMGAMLAGLGIAGAVFFLIIAVLYGLMGWGLWTLKNWARIIALVFAVLGLCFGVLGLLGSLLAMEVISLFLQLVSVGINGLITWYLLQPHVKRAFGVS